MLSARIGRLLDGVLHFLLIELPGLILVYLCFGVAWHTTTVEMTLHPDTQLRFMKFESIHSMKLCLLRRIFFFFFFHLNYANLTTVDGNIMPIISLT